MVTHSQKRFLPPISHSLQSKMIGYFGLLFTVVFIIIHGIKFYGVPLTDYTGEYADYKQNVFHHLNLVADLKKNNLLHWLEKQFAETQLLSENALLQNAVTALYDTLATLTTSHPSDLWQQVTKDATYQTVHQHLEQIKQTDSIYETIQLIDTTTHTIIASTRSTDVGSSAPYKNPPELPLQTTSLIGIEVTPPVTTLLIAAPFLPQKHLDKKTVLIIHYNVHPLFALLHSQRDFGNISETWLLNQDLQWIYSASSFSLSHSHPLRTRLLKIITDNQETLLMTSNSHDNKILIAYRPLAIHAVEHWGLAFKVDYNEIFIPLYLNALYRFLVSLIVGLILSLSFAFILTQKLLRPINSLYQTIQQIEAGDKEARAPVTTHDEFGKLALLFNDLIEQNQYARAKMEWLIEQNAAELRTSNFSLVMTVEEMQDLNDDLAQEIAERKKIEMQLRQERIEQQIIFDSVPAFIWRKDKRNNVVWMNKPAAHLSGVPELNPDSRMGYPFSQLFPEGANADYQEDLEVIHSGQSKAGIMRRVLSNEGKELWIRIDKVPYVDEKGELIGVIVLGKDVTARVQAEMAVQESEQRFRAIIDTAVDGIIMIDAWGKIHLNNPALATMFDYTKEELLALNFTSLLSKEYAKEYENYLRLYRETGAKNLSGTGQEIMARDKNGSLFPIYIAISSLKIKNQQMFTGIISDITELKIAQEALQKSKEALEIQNKAYSRFVPREFLGFLGKRSIVDVQLGDQVQQDMTIMFADIRNFTTLSEKMTPAENFRFINSYLSVMEPVVQAHRGFIDKYIGDSIMALFPNSPDDAVRAGIAMLLTLAEFNQGRQRAGYAPIQIGIGLHLGTLMLGTIGGKNRMDGTVISDAVNLASRVEGLTKIYGTALLITEQTYNILEDDSCYQIRIIDRVKVKGKTEPVIVFEVFDGDASVLRDAKLATLDTFTEAFVAYQRGCFDIAKRLFQTCLQFNPHDKASQIYLQRCQRVQKTGADEEWNGISESE